MAGMLRIRFQKRFESVTNTCNAGFECTTLQMFPTITIYSFFLHNKLTVLFRVKNVINNLRLGVMQNN